MSREDLYARKDRYYRLSGYGWMAFVVGLTSYAIGYRVDLGDTWLNVSSAGVFGGFFAGFWFLAKYGETKDQINRFE